MPGAGQSPQVAVKVPFARTMPWVLIGLGIALAIATFILRNHKEVTSTVTTSTAPTTVAVSRPRREPTSTQGVTPKPRAETGAASAATDSTANQLRPTSSTSTQQGLSDTLVGSLTGIAAILILLGAFYPRISKFTVAGNSVELSPVTDAQEADQIASAVTTKVITELRDRGELGETISADQAQELAQTAAAAAAQTQQQVAQVRNLATALTVGAAENARRGAQSQSHSVSLEADQVTELGSGMPFPPDLLSRLADRAVKEKVGPEEDARS